MKSDLKSFLGTGWAFPPAFSKYDYSVQMVSELEDIMESIRIILKTQPGERIMQPEFGCPLRQMIFEPNDESFQVQINEIIDRALLNFEPRIKFIGTELREQDTLDGFVKITIDFSVIITNTRHNIVFSFLFQ